jgi:hypothetical protein
VQFVVHLLRLCYTRPNHCLVGVFEELLLDASMTMAICCALRMVEELPGDESKDDEGEAE